MNSQHDVVAEAPVQGNAAPTAFSDGRIKKTAAKKTAMLMTFIGVCCVAIGYVLFWVANIILGGDGVSNSNIITSLSPQYQLIGRVATSAVHTAILAGAIIAIVYAIKLFVNKGDPAISVSKISLFPKVLFFFAVFACVDAFIVFFFTLTGNSIVGFEEISIGLNGEELQERSLLQTNYELITIVVASWGYGKLGVDEMFAGKEDSTLAMIAAIGFGLVVLVYAIVNIYLMSKVTTYYTTLSSTVDGAQYDKGTKPPFVLSVIFAVFNLGFAAASLMAGVWVDAVIQAGMALFLGCGAWMFFLLHKDLHKTSVD